MRQPLAQNPVDPVGVAPLEQVVAVGLATTLITLATLALIVAYRRGGARPLRALAATAERILGLPGWAAVPGIAALLFGGFALFGVTWDVALHLDQGRDEGPLGTLAHYPILIGLLGLFQSGVLAVGMAPRRRAQSSPAALRIRGLGAVPPSAVLLVIAAGLAFMGFPLDDLWHRLFGQDVTLWGPTHVMMIACAVLGVIAGVLLLVEGAQVTGRDLARRGPFGLLPIPALVGTITLLIWAVLLGEFDWGMPQYRLVWHPLILAFAAAQGLVIARVWGGRGAALIAWVGYFPLLGIMSLIVGGPLGQSLPSLPLFLVSAVAVELVAWRGIGRSPVRFGVVAGLLCGTVGFASEYAWSQIAMPIPWTPQLLPEGLPTAVLAGVAGGVIGAVFVQSLMGQIPIGRPQRMAAVLASVLVVGLGVNALSVDTPKNVTATITTSDVRSTKAPGKGGVQPTANLRVRFDPPTITDDALWVQAMGWQGGGLYVNHLQHQPDGSWTTTKRAPVSGNWKTVIRVHAGRTMLAAPVFMRRDSAIDFAGFPVRPTVTRAMVFDQQLLQIERKADVPMWLWTPAILLVLAMVAALAYATGTVAARIGRAGAASSAAAVDAGPGPVPKASTTTTEKRRPRGPATPRPEGPPV